MIDLMERDPGTGARAGVRLSLSACEELLEDAERDVVDAADELLEALDANPELLEHFPECSELDILLDAARLRRADLAAYDAAELAEYGPVQPTPPGPTMFTPYR